MSVVTILPFSIYSCITDTVDRTLRSGTKSNTSTCINTRTGVFEKKCVFCDKTNKKTNYRKETLQLCATFSFQEGVWKDALAIQDSVLLRKIHNIDFIAKEVRYHNSCRTELSDKAKAINKKKENEKKQFYGRDKKIRKSAFDATITFVEEKIMKNEEVHRIADLSNQYLTWLVEFGFSDEKVESEAVRKHKYVLLDKLLTHFGDLLSSVKHPKPFVGKILFKSTMTVQVAIRKTFSLGQQSPDVKVSHLNKPGYLSTHFL